MPVATPVSFKDLDGNLLTYESRVAAVKAHGVGKNVIKKWAKQGYISEVRKTRPHGFLKDVNNVKAVLEEYAAKNEEIKSTPNLLKKIDQGLYHSISQHHGGIYKFWTEVMEWELKKKPKGYWNVFDNVVAEWKTAVAEHGRKALSSKWLAKNGYSFICRAIRKHGGIDAFRDVMGMKVTGNAAIQARPAIANIKKLVEALGESLEDMDITVWLRVLKSSGCLDSIGDHGQLTPIKSKMLSGVIKPSDFKPTGEVDEDGNEIEPPAIQAIIDAANRTEDTATSEDLDTEIDIYEDEEDRQRLSTRSPLQIMTAGDVAVGLVQDQQTMQDILGDCIESLWNCMHMAAPEERDEKLAELVQTALVNDLTREALNGFMQEWKLIKTLQREGIHGIVKPEGGDLNLMQYREAALLRRDAFRFNFSDMGSGKTLSAVAGMQLSDVQRALVLCPNNTIPSWSKELRKWLPSAFTAQKTWDPEFEPDQRPLWVLNNHEMVVDNKREDIATFLDGFRPEGIIIDEIHEFRDSRTGKPSQRYQILIEVLKWARQNQVKIYSMTGTPVMNRLQEAVDLLAMVDPSLSIDVPTSHSDVNILNVHAIFRPHTTRYVPAPAARLVNKTIDIRIDHLLDDIRQAGRNHFNIDASVAQAKIPSIIELAKKEGKLLVFTDPVEGVVDLLMDALHAAGIGAVKHTGKTKFLGTDSTVELFKSRPEIKVMVASTKTLSTGVDGLQFVCNRCCFLTLPWTPAVYRQAIARLLRQGTAFDAVEVYTVVATLFDPAGGYDGKGGDWSYDQCHMNALNGKGTILDGVLDGNHTSKDGRAINEASVKKAYKQMVERANRA